MEEPLDSSSYKEQQNSDLPGSGWLKVGVVAAASALAGGLAAAWYYRKTLARLRQAEGDTPASSYSMAEDDLGEGI